VNYLAKEYLMVNQRMKQENPMPVIDEGWWTSVLAEEEQIFARAGNQRVEKKAAPSRVVEKLDPAIKDPPHIHAEKEVNADWEHLKDLYMRDQIIDLKVTGFNRGGLLVEGNGLYGFVPFSHLIDMAGKVTDNGARDHELESYVGRTLHVKVIECAPEDGRVVFSERAAQSESGRRTEIFSSLQSGQNVTGTVTNITDFGVFVDLGGVEGLIHISELSWGRVSHPTTVVSMGSQINVQVLDLSMERCRVALSLKRMQPNPWLNATAGFPQGSIQDATITTVLSYGVFARLDAGVEGLVHASEIPQADDKPVKEVLSEGQRVKVRILHLDSAHQRMGLSMRLE
jgi:small subunit ribosomal protein S1